MRLSMEQEDILTIADLIIKQITPLISDKSGLDDDAIFDVQGVADYLKVSKKWIYDHVSELPHFKLDGFLRFQKRKIDAYIDRQSKKVSANQAAL